MQSGSSQTSAQRLSLLPFGNGFLQDLLHGGISRLRLAITLLFFHLLPEFCKGRRLSPRPPC